jgi:hypothetical protein
MYSTIIEPTTGNAEIENQINIIVKFPDATLPTPTNGGFETQAEFMKFVLNTRTGDGNPNLSQDPHQKKNTVILTTRSGMPFHFNFRTASQV